MDRRKGLLRVRDLLQMKGTADLHQLIDMQPDEDEEECTMWQPNTQAASATGATTPANALLEDQVIKKADAVLSMSRMHELDVERTETARSIDSDERARKLD